MESVLSVMPFSSMTMALRRRAIFTMFEQVLRVGQRLRKHDDRAEQKANSHKQIRNDENDVRVDGELLTFQGAGHLWLLP